MMPWLLFALLLAFLLLWLIFRTPRSLETVREKRREIRRIEIEYGHSEDDPNRKRD